MLQDPYEILENVDLLFRGGKYSDALESLSHAEQLALKNERPDALAAVYGSFGNIHYKLDNFEKAKGYLDRALKVSEQLALIDPSYNTWVARALYELSAVLGNMGLLEEAKLNLERALKIRVALLNNDPDNAQYQSDVAMILKSLGTQQSQMSKFEEAKLNFEKEAEIRDSLLSKMPENEQNQYDTAIAQNNLGRALQEIGKFKEAKLQYEKAVKIFLEMVTRDPKRPENIQYLSNLASTTTNLGIVFSKMGELKDAELNYKVALQFYGALRGNDPENAEYQLGMAVTQYNLNNLLRWGPYYNSGVLMEEGNAMLTLAELGKNPVDNLGKAIELFERARKEGFIKNTQDYALTLINEGLARGKLAELGVNSVENLEKAIELCERARKEGFAKDTLDYARALMREGVSRKILAEFGINSIDNLEKAMELNETARKEGFAKNTGDYALTLMNEGTAMLTLAELGVNSIENYEKAIELYESAREEGLIENIPDYAAALMNEGIARGSLAFLGIGSTDAAKKITDFFSIIELFERARKEGFAKNTLGYGKALLNEGIVRAKFARLGVSPEENLEKAIELYEMARKEGLTKNTPSYARTLSSEGTARTILAELADKQEKNTFILHEKEELAELRVNSINNLRKSIELFERARKEGFAKNTKGYALTLMEEGIARIKLAERGIENTSNLNRAEAICLEAKDIFRQINDKINLITVNVNIGNLKYFNNEMPEAYQYLREAIQMIEEMRSSIKTPELRKDYFETVVDGYKTMIFTCLALNKDEEAFRYAEFTKGRTFLELLASEKKKIKGKPELVEKYRDVSRKMGEIELEVQAKLKNWWEGKEGEQLERVIKENEILLQLKKLRDDLLKEIKQSDPEYYDIETAEPVSADEISKILNGRTLVEYFLANKLAIFVVNAGLTTKIVEIGEREVFEDVTRFRNFLTQLEIEKAEEILTRFYKLLIKPVEQYLSKDKEVVIVPHSYLHQIPFQALKGDRYLIEDYKICFAQSASSLKFLKKGIGKGVLVVGNPTKDLEFAEDEAIEVAKLLNTKPILRDEAKRDKIMREIKNKEILHFSCHGWFYPLNPSLSRITLSDGDITAADFMDLEMNANLTVLSACETALSDIVRGDEVEGLIRAIQYAGCRFVIASLWKVDDESTKELFLKFYSESGDIVDRIRKAEISQLRMMKEYGFYHWAPFQVYGI